LFWGFFSASSIHERSSSLNIQLPSAHSGGGGDEKNGLFFLRENQAEDRPQTLKACAKSLSGVLNVLNHGKRI